VGVKHESLSRVSGSALPSAFIAFFYLAISIYIPNLILWQVTFVVHNYFWSGSLSIYLYNDCTDLGAHRERRYPEVHNFTHLLNTKPQYL
jgi:hypothetical protein